MHGAESSRGRPGKGRVQAKKRDMGAVSPHSFPKEVSLRLEMRWLHRIGFSKERALPVGART